MRILLVDDDPGTRDGYAELLETAGFHVIVAGTVEEAIASCREQSPDAIITDVALPDADGFELAAALRALPGTRSAPILAMTGFWATDLHDRAVRAGITEILAKPCQPEHLLAEVRRALRRTPQRLD